MQAQTYGGIANEIIRLDLPMMKFVSGCKSVKWSNKDIAPLWLAGVQVSSLTCIWRGSVRIPSDDLDTQTLSSLGLGKTLLI